LKRETIGNKENPFSKKEKKKKEKCGCKERGGRKVRGGLQVTQAKGEGGVLTHSKGGGEIGGENSPSKRTGLFFHKAAPKGGGDFSFCRAVSSLKGNKVGGQLK